MLYTDAKGEAFKYPGTLTTGAIWSWDVLETFFL